MAAQAYRQKQPASTPGAGPQRASSPPPPPAALRWLVVGVAVGVILLVALPVAMMIGRDGFLAESIMQNDPSLDPRQLEFAINAAIIYAVVIHAIDVVLTIWFVVKVLQGRQWARIALTAYLVVATFGSLYSAGSGSAYLWAVIPSDVLHIAMLALLWVPRSVRRFFAAHRAAHQAELGSR